MSSDQSLPCATCRVICLVSTLMRLRSCAHATGGGGGVIAARTLLWTRQRQGLGQCTQQLEWPRREGAMGTWRVAGGWCCLAAGNTVDLCAVRLRLVCCSWAAQTGRCAASALTCPSSSTSADSGRYSVPCASCPLGAVPCLSRSLERKAVNLFCETGCFASAIYDLLCITPFSPSHGP